MPARMTVARGCLKSCLLIKLQWERYFGSSDTSSKNLVFIKTRLKIYRRVIIFL